MKRTMEIMVMVEYDDADVVIEDDIAYLTRATLHGYDIELPQEVVETINEDALCGNQLYWSRQEYDRERAIDAADYAYHRHCDDLAEAKFSAVKFADPRADF